MLVLRLEPLLAKKAKERQGKRNDLIQSVADAVKDGKVRPLTAGAFLEANIPQNSAESETREKLASLAGVSHDTIAKVKLLDKECDEANTACNPPRLDPSPTIKAAAWTKQNAPETILARREWIGVLP